MGEFVSIIISTYHSKTIQYVLDALEQQTLKQFEVIVSDDGSNDFSKLGGHSYPLRYVWHQDLGRHWSRTHNEGIALASGKWIVFLHDDVIPEEHLVERTLQLMKDDCFITGVRDDIPRSSIAIKNPKQHVKKIDHRIELNKIIFNAFDYQDSTVNVKLDQYFNDPYCVVSGCLMAFPTKALRVVGGAPEDYPGQGFEDYDIALRLVRNGLTPYLSYGLRGYHLEHPELKGNEVDKNNTEFKLRVADQTYTNNFNHFPLL